MCSYIFSVVRAPRTTLSLNQKILGHYTTVTSHITFLLDDLFLLLETVKMLSARDCRQLIIKDDRYTGVSVTKGEEVVTNDPCSRLKAKKVTQRSLEFSNFIKAKIAVLSEQ